MLGRPGLDLRGCNPNISIIINSLPDFDVRSKSQLKMQGVGRRYLVQARYQLVKVPVLIKVHKVYTHSLEVY